MKETAMKWLIGAGLTGLLALGGLFLHYQIKDQVGQQLTEAGIPPREMIVEMQKDIEANRERTVANEKNNDKLDSKIERIVDILLED